MSWGFYLQKRNIYIPNILPHFGHYSQFGLKPTNFYANYIIYFYWIFAMIFPWNSYNRRNFKHIHIWRRLITMNMQKLSKLNHKKIFPKIIYIRICFVVVHTLSLHEIIEFCDRRNFRTLDGQ